MSAFWVGFESEMEKEARLKELALAGLLAASPAAKAGQTSTAVRHAVQAAQKQFAKKAPAAKAVGDVARKAQNIQVGGAGAGKVSLKDLNRLEYKKGPFTGSLSPEELKAQYNIGKGLDIQGKTGKSGNYIGMMFKRDF